MPETANDFSALLARARRGDRTAQETLVRQYEPKVRLVARVLLGPALRPYLDSLDLVQSVHRSLLLGIRQEKYEFGTPENLMALALTMVRRKVARQWRHLQRQRRLESGAAGCDSLPQLLSSLSSPGSDPAHAAQLTDQLDQLCTTLSESDRRLVQMRLDGFSPNEIATDLGLSAVAYRVRMTRLRQKLQAAGVFDEIW